MNRIIIDSDDYFRSSIDTLFFPGGEPHAKVPKFDKPVLLYLKARTWNDVGIGACVWDALWRQYQQGPSYGADWATPRLFMPYSPGARQDRSDGTAPLTKALIGRLFDRSGIHVFDLHSDLAYSVWNPNNWMPSDLGMPQRPDVDFVIAPDKGAVERAENFARAYCPNAQMICATKHRDGPSGKLSNYTLPLLTKGGKYLVVDDICDGGGTFELLGKAFDARLEELPDGDDIMKTTLELFVSHGIFSKGFDRLRAYYDHFHTTDSFFSWALGKYEFKADITVHSLRTIVERISNES